MYRVATDRCTLHILLYRSLITAVVLKLLPHCAFNRGHRLARFDWQMPLFTQASTMRALLLHYNEIEFCIQRCIYVPLQRTRWRLTVAHNRLLT
jgi:hypothetical protein